MFSQLNKWFLLISLFLLWSSCSDNTEYEILSSEDILPQAQGNYDYSEDTLLEAEMDKNPTQELLLKAIPEITFDENNELKERKILFMPDRLGYSNKEETFFMKDNIPFHFIEWTFADSLKTRNAFYNWLDCFGEKCKSIRISDEINGSPEAFLIWVSNESIYYLRSNQNLNKNYWESIFFKNDDIKWNLKMQQAKRGRILWVLPMPEIEKPVRMKNPESK